MIKFITMMFVTTSVFACNLTQAQKDEAAGNGYWDEDARIAEARNWMNGNEELLSNLGVDMEKYNLANGYWEDVKWD